MNTNYSWLDKMQLSTLLAMREGASIDKNNGEWDKSSEKLLHQVKLAIRRKRRKERRNK